MWQTMDQTNSMWQTMDQTNSMWQTMDQTNSMWQTMDQTSHLYKSNRYYLNLQDFVETINLLPEFDKPSYFNLPENIERSSQRVVSSQVIGSLKVLMRADAKASKFDKELWQTELSPILNLWKRLNQVSTELMSALSSRI